MIANYRWIIALLTAVLSWPAFAAKVLNIDPQKKVIMIDEGTDTKFVKKAKVCFYDANNVKMGCSFVRTAKPRISFIKIKNEKLFAKVQMGMTVKLDSTGTTTPGTPGIAADAAATLQKNKPKSYVTGLMLLPLLGPISYQNLIYETPNGATDVKTMWSSDSAVKNLGFGLELGLGISSFQLSVGLRSRMFLAKKIASDYADQNNDKNFEQFVDTTAPGTSFGGWLDFYWLIVDFGVVDFRLGNGIDVDSSTVNFEAVQKSDDDDQTTKIYAAKSTLQAISLRILPTLDFIFGPVTFTLGAVIYVPLSQTAKLTLETLEDPFISALNADITPEQDLKDSLKHEAKPGADLLLSAGFVF